MAAEKKKILFILQLPPPVHGVSIMNSNVINSELIKNGFRTEVINLQFAKSIEKLTKFSFRKIFKAIVFGYKIIIKIIKYKPDLVYFTLSPVGFAFYRDIFYVFLLKLFNKKIVFHLHGKGINKKILQGSFIKYLYIQVFRNTYVICLSSSLVTDISGIYKPSPFIVPNGIKVQSLSFNNETNLHNTSVPHILYLSNYLRSKGILILIEALSILQGEGYNFKARFVGAPADLSVNYLQNFLNEKKLTECSEIVGPLFGDKKIIEFMKANIFVFPSFYENEAFPLVILEAYQYKLPVISTYEGGIPDIVVDNETGFLVNTQNTKMLSDKIAILLKDKPLRIKMGKKGYERFSNNYTLQHFENNINRTFQTILGT